MSLLAIFLHIWAKLGKPPEDGEMIGMTLSSDTGFENRAYVVLGRARYLSVTELTIQRSFCANVISVAYPANTIH